MEEPEKTTDTTNKPPEKPQAPAANSNKKAVYELTIEGKTCRLCEPNRHVIEAAFGDAMGIGNKDPKIIQAGGLILKSCWVDGDKEILENDRLYVSACLKAYELVDIADAELKKL